MPEAVRESDLKGSFVDPVLVPSLYLGTYNYILDTTKATRYFTMKLVAVMKNEKIDHYAAKVEERSNPDDQFPLKTTYVKAKGASPREAAIRIAKGFDDEKSGAFWFMKR